MPEERSAKLPKVVIDLTEEPNMASKLPPTPTEVAPQPDFNGFPHSKLFNDLMTSLCEDPIIEKFRESWKGFAEQARHVQVDPSLDGLNV